MNLGNTSLINTGTVSLPVGQTSIVDGDYTQLAPGVIDVGVLSAAPGEYAG